MAPASLVVKAQKFRRWYREQVLKLFDEVDAILAPATPCTAPLIGQQMFMHRRVEMPVRANLGIYTQPISFIGLPVVAVPVPLDAAADRRADHRRALARGRGVARRACAGSQGRRCAADAAARVVGFDRRYQGGEYNGDRPAGGRRRSDGRVRALRKSAGVERRRDARRAVPRRSAHHPLWRLRKSLWL